MRSGLPIRVLCLALLASCGANTPPRFHLATHLESTAAHGPFEVWADVSDDAGVARVELLFRTRPPGGSWSEFEGVRMEALGERVFRASLPAVTSDSTAVEYELAAIDHDEAVTRYPSEELVSFVAGAVP